MRTADYRRRSLGTPPPLTKVTIVGTSKLCNRERLIRPFLVHRRLGPRPPPPLLSSHVSLGMDGVFVPASTRRAPPRVSPYCGPLFGPLRHHRTVTAQRVKLWGPYSLCERTAAVTGGRTPLVSAAVDALPGGC